MRDLFVTTTDGSTFHKRVDRVPGSPEIGAFLEIGGEEIELTPHEEQPDSCLVGSSGENISSETLIADAWRIV